MAERKHRHIVETGLAMLHKTKLHLSYWSYTFNTAVYLLNRIPSSALNFVSPLQKLYLRKPSRHALKVFGCACFPFLKPYSYHKFDPKSNLCIFLRLSFSFKRLYLFRGFN